MPMEQDHIRRAEASVIESIDIENMLDAQNDGRSFFSSNKPRHDAVCLTCCEANADVDDLPVALAQDDRHASAVSGMAEK
jgi:hypothetical protein